MSMVSVEEWDAGAAVAKAAANLPPDTFTLDCAKDSRFNMVILVFGRPAEAAVGLAHYMKIPAAVVRAGMNEGMQKIQEEIRASGTDEDKECLHYCLHEKAGSSDREFPNGTRDKGRNGESFDDFVNHETSEAVGLEPPHVLALRLYSTACYKSINGPLRDQGRTDAHPLAVTVSFVDEAVRKLRAVDAMSAARERTMSTSSAAHMGRQDLWRGMRNANLQDDFLVKGGTELAPMSTTTDLGVALLYSASKAAVLLRLATSSFMERGADISFLSAFPAEKEVLFPPLTFLRPTGNVFETTLGDASVKIVEVVPSM